MDLMARYPDNFFDLAIVDPPYFSGPEKRKYYGAEKSTYGIKRREYNRQDLVWQVPGPDYFKELFRVSKHQIIWGCNYFDFNAGSGRIIWDKINYNNSFSDCEIAYCSLHDSVRIFRFMWNGMMQGKSIKEGWIMRGDKTKNQFRIHPTEKPIELYHWQLMKYAKPGFKILDTHLGSASIAIACFDLGFDLTGSEISASYFELSMARLEQYKLKKIQNIEFSF